MKKPNHIPRRKIVRNLGFLQLNPIKFALAAAIITATTIFLITLTASLNHETFSTITAIISDIYGIVGYSVSIFGAFLGAIYAFIDTFITAFVFIWLYNKLL